MLLCESVRLQIDVWLGWESGRSGKIAERRAWVIELKENDYR
jgi:hypothetical protein